MDDLLKELLLELEDNNTERTTAFLNLVRSNGDVLVMLEEQLQEEGGYTGDDIYELDLVDMKSLLSIFKTERDVMSFVQEYWESTNYGRKYDIKPQSIFWGSVVQEIRIAFSDSPYQELEDVVELEISSNDSITGNPIIMYVGTIVKKPDEDGDLVLER